MRGNDAAQTAARAGRSREAFASHVFQIGNRSSVITASIGGVQIGEKIASVTQVLAKANQGVQSSIGVGGNRFEVFDPSAVERAEEEHVQAWVRSEEHTSELQSLMRISYAVFCLNKKNKPYNQDNVQTCIRY